METDLTEEFELKTNSDSEGSLIIESEYEEDLETIVTDTDLNVEELLRQAILVELPLQPLCSEDCKGLCPKCGNNFNEGLCSCQKDADESPFIKLENLLKKEDTK